MKAKDPGVKMNFKLDSNEINVQTGSKGVRLKTNTGENQLLANVSLEEIKEVVSKNYYQVKQHYAAIVRDQVGQEDLEKVSLKIVLYYFYMYQLWRTLYKKDLPAGKAGKNRNLAFVEKDLDHPSTADTIIFYFKSAYPKEYAKKCEAMLGMNSEQFKTYEKNRQAFFDLR